MKETLKISGMHCASCAMNIEKGLSRLAGVQSCEVNFATQTAAIEVDSNIDRSLIKSTLEQLGFALVTEKKKAGKDEEAARANSLLKKVIVSTLLSFPIFIRMFWMWELPGQLGPLGVTQWLVILASAIVVFVIGRDFHVSMLRQLKMFKFNMDTLISVGTLTAFFYSVYAVFAGRHEYFETAVTITTLILLGKYLEALTKGKASEALRKLMELEPQKARLVTDALESEVPVEQIRIGDIVRVKPSERIPLDGRVVEGTGEVDESMLTGESMPVAKQKGYEATGGTINLNSVLDIRVTRTGEDTVLGQIIRTVEQAQQYKAPIQKLADRVAGIFVPVVLSLALLTFAGWFVYNGQVGDALIKAVAVVIISCPCALGIATPIAVMVGSTQGSKQGILIKKGESFEKAKDIDTIVFDKTGTLSQGKVAVDRIIWDEQIDESEQVGRFKKIAALEKLSEHPLAKAIAVHQLPGGQNDNQDKPLVVKDFEEIRGRGTQGMIGEIRIWVGNQQLMQQAKIHILELLQKQKQDLEKQGKTVVVAAFDDAVQCLIALSDQLKANAVLSIVQARKAGLQTMMITGDNQRTARAIADQLAIETVYAEILPQGKAAIIKQLQAGGHKVAFAGDGINDAPALVQADLGVAMGAGTDIAKESGDIILTHDDPLKIVEAIDLSKSTYRIIKQNLFWAFFYNAAAIPLAMLGVVNPMIAALAMAFSDVTVIGNALRLKKF